MNFFESISQYLQLLFDFLVNTWNTSLSVYNFILSLLNFPIDYGEFLPPILLTSSTIVAVIIVIRFILGR